MTHHFEENPTNTIPWRPRELPRPASLPAARAIELFYPSLGHSDCIERLEDASRNGGLSVVVGDTGLGKSLLLDVCLDDLALRHTVVVVRDPHEVRTDTQLLKAIITQAGAKPSGRSGIAMMGDLDELVIWQIITQISQEAPRYGLDADHLIGRLVYGVGTRLITSWGEPALGGARSHYGLAGGSVGVGGGNRRLGFAACGVAASAGDRGADARPLDTDFSHRSGSGLRRDGLL